MTIASIANAPQDQKELSAWAFAHSDIVHRTVTLLNNTKGTSIAIQPLSTVPLFDIRNWLQRVQYVHNAINNTLGTTGNDLTALDPSKPEQVQEWVALVFQEALEWQAQTGIG